MEARGRDRGGARSSVLAACFGGLNESESEIVRNAMARAKTCTIKDIAREAGVGLATVSLALRGDSEVAAATAARIKAVAGRLGYRPDLRISSLMARVRKGGSIEGRETIALVWVSTSRAELRTTPYLQAIRAGTLGRSEELGCRIEEFWPEDDGLEPRRLGNILRTRGIVGVIFSPAFHTLAVTWDWEWGHFAAAVIGNSDWQPALHRAGHYHYRSMWEAMRRLIEAGSRRPAAWLNADHHERLHGAQLGAFVANHPCPLEARKLGRFAAHGDLEGVARWAKRTGADALIVGYALTARERRRLREAGTTLRHVVTLEWWPGSGGAGMQVRNELIAARALELVVAQLHRSERGVPLDPTTTLSEGIWREG